MALKISLSTYVSGGYVNPVRWDLYETGTGVLVDSHTEDPPHGQVYNFSFVNNIRDIVYTIKLYDVPPGSGIGNLIKAHDVTPSTSTITFDADIELIVDGGQPQDPITGQTVSPANPNLEGKDYYVVQRDVGQRRIIRQPEVTIDNSAGHGTFTLLNGEQFTHADTWIVKIRPQYVVNPPGSVGSTQYKDIVFVTTDTTIQPTDFGKMFVVDGSTAVVTLSLPAKSLISLKLSLFIKSIGTTHNNVIIQPNGGDTISGNGQLLSKFIMGRETELEIIQLNNGTTNQLYGFTDDVDIKKRGQVEWAYYVGLNRLAADGSRILKANYPSLDEAVNRMPSGSVVTEALWNTPTSLPYIKYQDTNGDNIYQGTKTAYLNKGFFARSADDLYIILPDLRNKFIRGLKFLDSTSDAERSTQGPGGYQKDDIAPHYHNAISSQGVAGFGRFTTGDEAEEGGDLTTYTAGATETRPENYGFIPTIII